MGGALGACHALEIGFVFGGYDATFCGTGPEAEALPAELGFPGPPLALMTTGNGLTAGVLEAGDDGRFALILALPGGTAHEPSPGAAELLASTLRRASTDVRATADDALEAVSDAQGVAAALDEGPPPA